MALFDFLRPKPKPIVQNIVSKSDLDKAVQDIKLATAGGSRDPEAKIAEAIKEGKKTLSKPLQYSTTEVSKSFSSRDMDGRIYHGPIYDLAEIARAMDVEAYIFQSIRKQRELILKEGYKINGPEQEMEDYVKRRIFEIELMSGVVFDDLIREFATNLVAFASSFIVLKRDIKRSSGKKIRIYGKELEPIAGLFPMDPTCVEVAVNKHGHPVKWKQTIESSMTDETTVFFDNSDVILGTIDKKPGFIFGTPYILPVLDDVRALRRLEEYLEVMCQKHAFPTVHWKVGEKEDPPQVFDNGVSEIDLVKTTVESVPSQGGLVTSHRVQHEVIGAAKEAFDILPAIEYYEKRVMGGLRLSSIDLGRGEVSKASAQTVSQSLQDASKDYQLVIQNAITYGLFLPLLLEGGYDVNPENMVRLEFPMINREEERSSQQHGQDLYLSNTISRNEFRKKYLGTKEMDEEQNADTPREQDFAKDYELARMQAAARAAAKAASSSGKKTSGSKKKVQNKVRPANQYGSKPIKTRVKANDILEQDKQIYLMDLKDEFKACQDTVIDFIKKHGAGVSSSGDKFDITTKQDELNNIFKSFSILTLNRTRSHLESLIERGISDFISQSKLNIEYKIPKKNLDRFFKNYIDKSFNRIQNSIVHTINSNNAIAGLDNSISPSVAIINIFDEFFNDIVLKSNQHCDLAYRFGFGKAAKYHNYNALYLIPEKTCDNCNKTGTICVLTSDKHQSFVNLLSTHDTCLFTISLQENT